MAQDLSFSLPSEPVQCANFTVTWAGGSPPYELTVVPVYAEGTLFNNDNGPTREVIDVVTNATSWTQPLPFPASSGLVAVLSDSTGFGSGGTSNVYTVGNSTDDSCLSFVGLPPQNWTFSVVPDNFSQCESVEFLFFYASGRIDPPLTITAIVPDGKSQVLPESTLFNWTAGDSTGSSVGWAMNWTASMQAGTQVTFLAGDQWGRAAGGWSPSMTVQNSTVSSCLSASTSTTTPGPTTTATDSSSSSTSSTKGDIAGGVVGGIAVVLLAALLALYLVRRRNIHRRRRSMRERSIGLMAYPFDGYNREDAPRGYFGSE